MAVGLTKQLPEMHPVKGLRLAAVPAGIKKSGGFDLVLMELCKGAQCAVVFTQNAFCAAPVIVARDHLNKTQARYLLINSGNANAGTGKQGLNAARTCCESVAAVAGCEAMEVLPFSTGVIGEPLPIDKIQAGLKAAYGGLSETGWQDAAKGIMTTDTVAKGVSKQITIDGEAITVTGIAKGSGMIHPDMATLLVYIATDAKIEQTLLQGSLKQAVEVSFNSITVDGDTSTNDACVLIATGQSPLAEIDNKNSASYLQFYEAVEEIFITLAQAVVRDGEGATKFMTVQVEHGASVEECRQVAFTVAHSPLVKTAFFASDPNWGRILAAIGRAGVEELDINAVDIYLDDICIVKQGGRAADYTEEQGAVVMKQDEITIRIQLGRGGDHVTVWTCDFSYDYVRINAEYRT